MLLVVWVKSFHIVETLKLTTALKTARAIKDKKKKGLFFIALKKNSRNYL
jgi:hypothetical protein